MYKLFHLIFIWGLVLIPLSTYSQFHLWSSGTGGTGQDFGWEVVVDDLGYVYTTGSFSGTVDFDAGTGVYELTSQGSSNTFVTKVDASGKLIWAKNFGGTNASDGQSLAVDKDGNVYTTGLYLGTTDFDPGQEIYSLTSAGSNDIFVCKLNAQGNFVWAKSMGGPEDDRGKSITIDQTGQILIAGSFRATADFDPGPDNFDLDSPSSSDNAYVVTLLADGTFVRVRHIGKGSQAIAEDIVTDQNGNIFVAGIFRNTCDFDPDTSSVTLESAGGRDIFLSRYNPAGQLTWVKQIGSISEDYTYSLALDPDDNIILSGNFDGTCDFDPGPDIFNMTSNGSDMTITKFDHDGNFIWARSTGGTGIDFCNSIEVDTHGDIYYSGRFAGTADFDPGADYIPFTSIGSYDAYISKLSSSGQFIWVVPFGGTSGDEVQSIDVDKMGNVFATGFFQKSVDFDPGPSNSFLNSNGGTDIFTACITSPGVSAYVFNDYNKNCLIDQFDVGIADRRILIQPGDIITKTNISGVWKIDSLAPGTYTILYDTSGQWISSCPTNAPFTVQDKYNHSAIQDFGMHNTLACTSPEVSVFVPSFRRCFTNQKVYFSACNRSTATEILKNGYLDIQFDSLISLKESPLPFTLLGHNTYRIQLPDLYPDQCFDFSVTVRISCDAILGQTLCVRADIFPRDTCVFGEINALTTPGLPPCAYQSERSHLEVEGWCENDSIYFAIHNAGESGAGDMGCFSKTRLFIDGRLMIEDSIQLTGGGSDTLFYTGDGRTWRLEVDQHPGHIGQSLPNATVELCGNPDNWTPGISSMLAEDDADVVTDIYCDQVSGSHDPNDKTGFPLGLDNLHNILPDGTLDYVIRFQNTGNDTAFNIIVRDTLDPHLDIFSVTEGVSSHPYEFQLYGNRILQWTFHNVLLPDSTTNEEESHGFITFKVKQNKNLPDGVTVHNTAAIYFDFNDPVITNNTMHTIDRGIKSPSWQETTESWLTDCHSIENNGIIYNHTGTYFQLIDGGDFPDTLATLNLTILIDSEDNLIIQKEDTLFSTLLDADYQWFDCETNTIIEGEINFDFMPGRNGHFSVITSKSDCIDTSACFSYLVNRTYENNDFGAAKIFPNPASDHITLQLTQPVHDVDIIVHNLLGNLVYENHFDEIITTDIPLHQSSGIYLLSLIMNGRIETFKVVVAR